MARTRKSQVNIECGGIYVLNARGLLPTANGERRTVNASSSRFSRRRNRLGSPQSPMLALLALAGDRASIGEKVPTIPSRRGEDDAAFHSGVRLRAFAAAKRNERSLQAGRRV